MESLHGGKVLSLKKENGFGFIRYNDGESIFFHFSQCREELAADDTVIFGIRESKTREGACEASAVRKVHRQPNGYNLVIGKFLRTTKEALPFLLRQIPDIKLAEEHREFIIETKFDHIIGKTLAIKTSDEDEVFYAKRFNKRGYSRFVADREPMDSDVFTVIINFNDEHGFYEISAAFFGPRTPPEPWDRRAKEDSLTFWRQHALIPDRFFKIEYDTVRTFDPDFFKTFKEIQANGEAATINNS